MACRVTPLRARLSRTLARAPVALGWWSRSDGVVSRREELQEVTVTGCPELETPEPDHVSCWERIRDTHRVWVGSARHPWRSNENKRENVTQRPLPGAPTVGALTRGSGSQLVNAACFLVPNVDATGNTVTHGFILVPATGRTSSKGVCEGTVLSFTRNACSRGTSEAREGGRLPSLC